MLIIKDSSEVEKIWIKFFPVAYMIVTFIYIFPVIVGMCKRRCSVNDAQKIFFILFISSIQILSSILLFIIQLVNQKKVIDNGSSGGNTEIIAPIWSTILLLVVIVILLFHYVVSTRNMNDPGSRMAKHIKNYKKAILYHFNEKKIFLNPDLTLNILSIETNIDKLDLEFFFTGYLRKSFSYFVAEYRVANAIKMIDSDGERYTLQTIGYESGFRSNASFNKYFKLITGMLPSEYHHIKKA